MRWLEVHKGDTRCRLLADGHYSRQTPGAPMFTRPGYSQVLYLDGPRGGGRVRVVAPEMGGRRGT